MVFASSVPRTLTAFVWLLAGVALTTVCGWVGLPPWRGVLAAACAVLVVAVLVRRAFKRMGGVTGDVFGAAVELSLATLLVTLA